MSGLEALFVLGVIANIGQLVEYSAKVLGRIQDVKHDSTHLPRVFWNLQTQLPLVANTLSITAQHITSGQLDEKTCAALRPVVAACESKIQDLQNLLRKIVPDQGDSNLKKTWKAITSMTYDKDVEEVSTSVQHYMNTISQYHVASQTLTTGALLAKVSAVVANSSPTAAKAPVAFEKPKRHFMVPTYWSEDFTGRAQTMQHLEDLLITPDKHARVAVIGLGGIGKTRIVLEFAHRVYKQSPTRSVFWIHASSLARVNKSCVEIAKSMKIAGWEDPLSNKLELIKQSLEDSRSGEWLMVIDNADEYDLLYGSEPLAHFLPRSSLGTILMTTRDAKVGTQFATTRTSIFLEAFTQEESIALLSHRLGSEENSDEDIRELSEELCGVPLALVQASSFMNQNYLSVQDYLELYRGSDMDKMQLLSEDFEDDVRDTESRNPVATTWSITFEFLRQQYPLAADILSVMSQVDSQAVPEALLQLGQKGIAFKQALGTLQAFSLITIRRAVEKNSREKAYDLHRLVRLAMRNWLLTNGQTHRYLAKAIKAMAEKFTGGDWDTRDKWMAYLPHALLLITNDELMPLKDSVIPAVFKGQVMEVNDHAPEGTICPLCTAHVLRTLAKCHLQIGNMKSSLAEAETALLLQESFLGSNHVDTLETLDLIAKPSKEMFKFERAVAIIKKSIEAKSKIYGPEHPSTLTSMAYLGITYRPMGKLSEAREIGLKVLEVRRRVLGDTHHDTLMSVSYVASASRSLGDYTGAQKLEEEHVARRLDLHGPSHVDTWKAQGTLAFAYACLGEYETASRINMLSLSQQIEALGLRNYFMLCTMGNQAVILGMQGKYLEAEELNLKLLPLREESVGVQTPFTFNTKLHLAWLWNETRRLKDAEATELEVLAFQRRFYRSENNDDVLLTKSQLASTYSFQGRHEVAEGLKREVLAYRLEKGGTGPTHPTTLRCMSSLGATLTHTGEAPYEEAETLLTGAWEQQKVVLGPKHPETITTMQRLGRLYRMQERRNDSAEMYERTVAISREVLGSTHPRTLERIGDLDGVLVEKMDSLRTHSVSSTIPF